jgi:hypothetical protein
MLVVAGATALTVAACGSSNTASPTSSPSTSASPNAAAPSTSPHTAAAHVSGLIASVSGNSAQITRENGDATVDFTATTKVDEVTPAALTDVITGSCVSVRPTHDESQVGEAVSAASVRVSPAVDGKCPQGMQSGHPKRPGVQGAVASVAGDTITVNGNDGSATTVTVTDKTRYTKQAGSSTQAITQGKCMTALGSRDGSGAFQATTINLRPASDGKCPGEGGPHRGHG